MPKSSGSSSGPPKKKKRKLDKKQSNKKKSSSQSELSTVCNITGIGGGDGQGGLAGDNIDDIWGNELDCLNELATAQAGGSPSANIKDNATAEESQSLMPQNPPPTLKEIPNLRVELARHLQVETLSIFLLQACPGLRMPTFERWLMDSKLEESDRVQSIAENWVTDPSSKLHFKNQKKKYGRAAQHSEENATQGREDARRMKESRILLDAEKSTIHSEGNQLSDVDRLVMKARTLIDPVLPGNPLESDPSSTRLVDEIVANKLKLNKSDETITKEQAEQIVSELLSRCSESVKEIQQLQNRFGTYQQFGFGKKRNKNSSGSSTSGLVRAEWPSGDSTTTKKSSPDDSVCSLSYITTKKKTASASVSSDNKDEAQKKTKPFIVKVNGQHYHKLRQLFDKTYMSTDSSVTKDQMTHAFHAALFAIIIRYSTLAGAQQLNDLRGGGMQGAVHDTVFDCFTKWFGTSPHSSGTECFASPFNANIAHYYSAFPSPDIDGFFGSQGDFFRLDAKTLRPGWYEANPPFSPGVMQKMAKRLMELLDIARERDIDVTFIVVIPSCQVDSNSSKDGEDASNERKKKKKKRKKQKHDSEEDEPSNTNALTNAIHHSALSSFKMLVKNCTSHIVLSKRDHGYVEGSQHLRPTQFKESQYDTSVIVLRSKSFTEIDAEAFEADLREAFKSRHLIELQQRRDCN
ncbi:mRNA (2'-O-methyladenosine-N(6)-)-methyltransferase [Skeletonema marinoi]|uniref:mRNA (2'-O-methyladenosine-N(6)-)-methyltransferase n=1 Tax=Skeletonema marinoi TaxID=267567 RepID=A0AAD8Y1X1_9STRA|nr:mRNA (2'-O-methyladenosine-N(6)-)-methyltransferase [Skeletonema marinoi]